LHSTLISVTMQQNAGSDCTHDFTLASLHSNVVSRAHPW